MEEKKINEEAFLPEEVAAGKMMNFVKHLQEDLPSSTETLITSDGFCSIVRWNQTRYVGKDGMWEEPIGRFVWLNVEQEEKIDCLLEDEAEREEIEEDADKLAGEVLEDFSE